MSKETRSFFSEMSMNPGFSIVGRRTARSTGGRRHPMRGYRLVVLCALAMIVLSAGGDIGVAESTSLSRERTIESVMDACLDRPSCIDFQEVDDVVYLVFESPARIERYDRQIDMWLPEILLPAAPRTLTIDRQGLRLGFGEEVLHLTLDGVQAPSTPWLAAKADGGIVYFVFQAPARIERYDLNLETWLAEIPLADTPTAFTVDAEGLYISFGRRTSRFALDGTGETHLRNTNADADDLFTHGNYLYINFSDMLLSVDKLTGSLVDSRDYFYSMDGFSVSSSQSKAFARSQGISPSDILEIPLHMDGTLGSQDDSPYHGDYPSASRTFVFPGGDLVADDSGIVYDTSDLTYGKSLAGSFDDLSFHGDLPIVLRDDQLIAYSDSFLETGRFTLPNDDLALQVHDGTVFSFADDGGIIEVTKTPVEALEPEEPGPPVDPEGLDYEPDSVMVDSSEIVYLLSKSHLSIFRWSIASRGYVETIPLIEAPLFMTLTENPRRLYLAYSSGKITMIELDSAFTEVPFVNSPQTPCGLASAGEFLFVCDPSGAWVSHFTYSVTGQLISQVEWNYFSDEYVWSGANRKMYFFRDGTSPNDLIWEDIDVSGMIGDQMDSPQHSSSGIVHPIRLPQDGSLVLLGSGRIYGPIDLVQVDTLSNEIDDAAWHDGKLITLRALGGESQLQKWGMNYQVDDTATVTGLPIRMFATNGNRLLVVTKPQGAGPLFSLHSSETLGAEIFADGFESGDLLAWTSSVDL